VATHDSLRIVAGGDVYLEEGRKGAPFAALQNTWERRTCFSLIWKRPSPRVQRQRLTGSMRWR